MFDKLVASLQSGYGRASFAAKKYSPELCIAGAIVAGIACVVTACKATTKLQPILDDHKQSVCDIHDAKANEDPECPVNEGKELAKATAKTGARIVKLYILPAILGGTSIALTLKSHNIMSKRNAALALEAAAAVQKLDDYRKRVIDRFGEDIDDELAGDVVQVKKKIIEKDPETGEEREREVTEREWRGYSDYARWFEEGCKGWVNPKLVGPQANIAYLKGMQATAQHILETKHYLTLNDVYDLLGFCRLEEANDLGWLHDPKKGYFDRVDFGLYNPKNPGAGRFLNGDESKVVIDFNIRKRQINNEIYIQNQHVMNFYMRERSRVFHERDV